MPRSNSMYSVCQIEGVERLTFDIAAAALTKLADGSRAASGGGSSRAAWRESRPRARATLSRRHKRAAQPVLLGCSSAQTTRLPEHHLLPTHSPARSGAGPSLLHFLSARAPLPSAAPCACLPDLAPALRRAPGSAWRPSSRRPRRTCASLCCCSPLLPLTAHSQRAHAHCLDVHHRRGGASRACGAVEDPARLAQGVCRTRSCGRRRRLGLGGR